MKISRVFSPIRKLTDAFKKRAEEAEMRAVRRMELAESITIREENFPLYQLLTSVTPTWTVQTLEDGDINNEKYGRMVAGLKKKYEAAQDGSLNDKMDFAMAMFNVSLYLADAPNWPAASHAVAEKTMQGSFAVYKEATRAGFRGGLDMIRELKGQEESGFLKFQLEPVETKPVTIQPPLRPYKPGA